jgi:hypothetical protein
MIRLLLHRLSIYRFHKKKKFKILNSKNMDEPTFKLPEIIDNDNGWGPSPVMLPEKFRDIPYAPYSKADKLGRIADWSTPEQREKESSGRQRTNYRNYRGNDIQV